MRIAESELARRNHVSPPEHPSARRLALAATVVLGLLLAALVITKGWLCDDSFITFRTVDNFIHDRGMTWNPGWRVQVFTHPLWMLLLSVVAALTGELPLTALWLGVVVSLTAAAVFSRALPRGVPWRVPVLLLLLMASKAFVDYSSSGLENPLSHLLLALFLMEMPVSRDERPGAGRVGILGLLASLLFLTRMDLALLVVPPLGMALWERRREAGQLTRFGAGLLPAMAWFLFATFYFGTPLPNTAWAKLATGIPEPLLLRQGLAYLWNSLQHDPVTLSVVVLALALAVKGGTRYARALATGVVFYLAYVVWIGGDFMSGRFLTAVFVCSAFLVAARVSQPWARVAVATALIGVLVSIVVSARPTEPGVRVLSPSSGICDEREYYLPFTGIRALMKQGQATTTARRIGATKFSESDNPLIVLYSVGRFGFFVAPNKIVVDILAVTDPLLARLPVRNPRKKGWRIGHFPRNIPEGYLESLGLDSNQIVEPHLRALFSELTLIAHGPLWSRARCRAIISMNFGRCRHLLRMYVASGACELPAKSMIRKPLTIEQLEGGLGCSEGTVEGKVHNPPHNPDSAGRSEGGT